MESCIVLNWKRVKSWQRRENREGLNSLLFLPVSHICSRAGGGGEGGRGKGEHKVPTKSEIYARLGGEEEEEEEEEEEQEEERWKRLFVTQFAALLSPPLLLPPPKIA